LRKAASARHHETSVDRVHAAGGFQGVGLKHCVVILDGASGWPLKSLGGRTTLQAASTPNLDALARAGQVGLARTVPAGVEPSSSAACTSILGYDPVADAVGRGAIEAASMGIRLAPGEIAMRMNLVHVDGDAMASYSCGHIPTAEAREIVHDLSAALGGGVFRFHPGVSYRHIMVVGEHPELLDTRYTPPHDISGKPIADYLPSGHGAKMLRGLMSSAHEVLAASDACRRMRADGAVAPSDIWPFWPGATPSGLVPFTSRRGVSAALTSGVDLLNGLAALTGIDRLEIPGVTDGPDNDYVRQAAGALKALIDHDLVVIHVETPDEAGHAGDVAGKIAGIEAIDRDILGRLRGRGDTRILAMPDHPTPIELLTHVGEPVPFVLAGPGITHNGATSFDEAAAAATGLMADPGYQVMDQLLAV
jgi:2,3-bisphosphoglycerate-independent phosphoglycerate mutase